MIRISERTMALTKDSIREIRRIVAEDIIYVVDRKAIRIREQMVPIINLMELLELPESKNFRHQDPGLLIIIANGKDNLGILVDDILNDEEVVLKPLPFFMRNNRFSSGIILSGQNKIIVVLEVLSLLKASRDFNFSKRRTTEAVVEKNKKNILVIDDSFTTREIEKDILESFGYQVCLAENGADGFAIAARQAFDIVVTDVEMPMMDGFTLTEKLRNLDNYRHTPIIIVTSRAREEDKKRGIQVGANAYIVKGGFDQASLLKTVQNLIGQ